MKITVSGILVPVILILAVLLTMRLAGVFGPISRQTAQTAAKVPPVNSTAPVSPPAVTLPESNPPALKVDPANIPTLSPDDSQALLKHAGEKVKIQGIVTHIESYRTSAHPDELWAFIFFNESAQESLIPGWNKPSPWDYVSYFRIVVKPSIMDVYSTASLENHIVTVQGTIDYYRGSPAIYLSSPDQITDNNE